MNSQPVPTSARTHTIDLSRFAGLSGKFHWHVTVRVADGDIDALRVFARSRRIKLTIIELSGADGREQRDIMTTEHLRDRGADAMTSVTVRMQSTVTALRVAGYPVTRIKLEHESLPSIPSYSRDTYGEAHLKLRIPAARYAPEVARLRELAPALGVAVSRNPHTRPIDGRIAHFVSKRFYSGTAIAAERDLAQLAAALERHGFEVSTLAHETVLLDTNLSLDAWWT